MCTLYNAMLNHCIFDLCYVVKLTETLIKLEPGH